MEDEFSKYLTSRESDSDMPNVDINADDEFSQYFVDGRGTPYEEPPQKPGFLQRAGQRISQRGQTMSNLLTTPTGVTGKSAVTTGIQAAAQPLGAIGDVVMEGVKTLPGGETALGALGGAVGAGVRGAARFISPVSEAIVRLEKTHPKVAKVITEALDSAVASGEIAGNILLAEGVSRTAVKLGDTALKTGQKTLAGVRGVGKATAKTGEKLYETAFSKSQNEARLLQNYQINKKFLQDELAKAKGTSEFTKIQEQIKILDEHAPKLASESAIERGVMGTEKMIGRQVGVEKMHLWKNRVEPALKSSPDKITKEELFKLAEETVVSEAEPARKAAFQRAFESLQEDYANFKSADLLSANKIKTSLDKFTPAKIFKGQDVANEINMLKADMADAIRLKTYTSLKDLNIREAYRDYANLKQLEDVGIKALTEAGYKGGFGNFWTSLWNATVTPIKTVGGQILYKVGNKLQFLGDKGIKTMGEHLDKVGIDPRTILGIKEELRPQHQMDIEAAANKGDWMTVKKIIEKIPPGDPYKSSMESLFANKFKNL